MNKPTKKTKTKIIYSSKIAGQLCRQGFQIVGTDINSKKPWLDTFIFEDTIELRKALNNIFNKEK